MTVTAEGKEEHSKVDDALEASKGAADGVRTLNETNEGITSERIC